MRVWVPACATGEEAYSIAMLLAEHARRLDAPPALQVFATDLDDDAIRARARGRLSGGDRRRRVRGAAAPLLHARRARLPRSAASCARWSLFAAHDLLKDAPFSRLDLVSCRNLLHLPRPARRSSARSRSSTSRCGRDGRLFLGVSETVDVERARCSAPSTRSTASTSRAWCASARLPPVGGDGVLARSLALQSARAAPGRRRRRPPGARSWPSRPSPEDARHRLVARAAPEADRALRAGLGHRHRRLRDGPHLRARRPLPAPWRPASRRNNLLLAVEPALTGDLRTALLRAREADEARRDGADPRSASDARGGVGADPRRPRRRHRAPASCSSPSCPCAEDAVPRAAVDDARRRRLPAPPAAAGRRAQVAPARRHRAGRRVTAQELKASNEELQAMNEELRSATEELETSREELQSINEELTTVNQELKGKVDELSHANGDLQNLMAATAIATVFLDREPVHLAVHAVGGRALQPDRRPTSAGRSATSPTASTTRSSTPTPTAVLDNLAPIEREVRFGERWLLARLRPYRSGDDRISGVVLTFVDISERRRVSEALRESEALFRTIVTQAAAGVAHIDLDGRITLVNARFAPDRRAHARGAGRHVGVRARPSRRPGRAHRGVPPPRRRRRRRSRWRCATCAATAASSG